MSLAGQSFSNAAAIFLISQVGDNKEATSFLKDLENDEDVGSMVFCSTEVGISQARRLTEVLRCSNTGSIRPWETQERRSIATTTKRSAYMTEPSFLTDS